MNIIIYIYRGMTMLDAIGPYEVLRNVKNAQIKLVAEEKGEITADSQFVHLNAKYSIDEVEQADILLIPGSTIAFIKEAANKKVLDWIKRVDQHTKKTVSVCTGSIILAAAGLLEGRKATSHWKPLDMLAKYGATPLRERVVRDGKYMTAAGVSAGIDMALHLVTELEGADAAKAAQLAIEYDPAPMYDSGNFSKADPEIIKLAEAQMARDAKKDLSLWEMIKHARTISKLK